MAKKFELNKGGEHNFDLSKQGKRKFDLSKDEDELEVLSPTGSAEATAEQAEATGTVSKVAETVVEKTTVKEPENVVPNVNEIPEISEEKKSNNAWMWVILILLVLGLLVWWLWPAPKDTEEPTVAAAVENVAEDSVAAAASEIDSLAAPAEAEEVAENVAGQSESAPVAAPAASQESAAPASAPAASVSAPAANASVPAASAPAVSGGTVEAEALNVIRGVYGNNPVRKEKLGARYAEIQKYVNQMKRNGKF